MGGGRGGQSNRRKLWSTYGPRRLRAACEDQLLVVKLDLEDTLGSAVGDPGNAAFAAPC